LALTLTGMVGARLSPSGFQGHARIFFDNLHWTCAYAAAALLASRAMLQASSQHDRRAAGWLTGSMLSLMCGQLIWNVQIPLGWMPFPGPSDIFFLGMGPLMTTGLWLMAHPRLNPRTRQAVLLDTLACVTAILAATMALFLPRQSVYSLFQICVMAAYVISVITPACLGVILALTTRAKPGWRAFLLPAAIAALTVCWTVWNLRFLSNRLVNGDWLNLAFSGVALLIGAGIKGYRLDTVDDPALDRRYEGLLRMLPLALVLLAAGGIIVTANLPDIDPAIVWSVQIGSAAVVIMAFVRQSLLLRERDQLILAERMLRQREFELEMRVAERTRDLALATRAAEAASQAKSDFLANMSHEIRTPLNGVLGFAQLALIGSQSPTQRDYLEKVQYSGKQLLRLINDILDMSKIEAGKLELENIPFDIDSVLKSAQAQLGHLAREKGLSLSVAASPPGSIRLMGDPLRIEQILLNYLSNAIKFTQQGGIIVRARQGDIGNGLCTLRLEVSDTGQGLPATTLNRLFNTFEQGDNATTRRHGGSGLGLAICKRLAELMGGDVGADSVPGQGSCFWFSVNLYKAQAHGPASLTPQHGGRQHSGHASNLSGTRVLLAEDNEVNQLLASSILEQVGATVRIARNGQEALDLLHQEPFDCVLMDVHMPDMDGLEATRRIRADAQLNHVRIIAMTANALSEDEALCISAGMDDFVCKPYDSQQLCDTIAKWTGQMAA
jgi:signal transduction histidine kinase/ActR/RegA family two-component response regulator